VFLLFIFNHTTLAQFYSNRYSLYASTNGYISSIQVAKDTVYAMCYVGDSLQPSISIAALGKFDKNGVLISMTPFSIPGKTNVGVNMNTLIKTNDGGFAYGGWLSGNSQTQNSIFILKYDRYGDFEWYREIADSTYYSFYCTGFIQDSSSNYYLSGAFHFLSNQRRDIFLIKTDSLGNRIYKKEYPYLFSGATFGLNFNKKGNLIIGGDAFDYNPFDYNTAKDYMLIYELDTAGNQLSRYLGTDTNGPQAYNILNAEDGGYMISNSHYCYRDRYKVKWQGAISKLDSNFHKVWEIDLGPCSQYTSFYAQTKCSDGNYIAVGIWHDDEDTIDNHRNGWIIKYSEDGHIIWNKLYRGASGFYGDDNRLLSIGFLSDSTIVCAGQSLNNDDAIIPQRGWLLHLDTTGCLPDSNNCGIINGIEEPKSQIGLANAYPNPATNSLTIECKTEPNSAKIVRVINILGSEIAYRRLAEAETSTYLDIKEWNSGLYFYNIVSEKGFTASGSFVVNH
jgi:hypothetical protein